MRTNRNDAIYRGESREFIDGVLNQTWSSGLTKREYFAAMAMQGMIANGRVMEPIFKSKNYNEIDRIVAEAAVEFADKLIIQLNKE